MMRIVEHEIHDVLPLAPGTGPDYAKDNPLWKLIRAMEGVELASGRESYLPDRLQYLFPFDDLAFYGPSGDDWQVKDPRLQDNKNDFQKQNIRRFNLGDAHLVRGYATAGDWTGPFLHLSYAPGTRSPLSAGGYYGAAKVQLFLKVGDASTGGSLLPVPYNEVTHRYQVELWGYPHAGFSNRLGAKAQAAIARGELLARPDLIRGSLADFEGPGFDALRDEASARGAGLEIYDVQPGHAMHPLRPLHVELAWCSEDGRRWDSAGSANHHYEFSMSVRGWRNYLGVGRSPNPHGGIGSLEYRNLYSNYFGYEARRQQVMGGAWLSELGRPLYPWSVDAMGRKPPAEGRELFMAVNYMDLHVVRPESAIGLHRHRDSLETFLMLHGKALMVTGDWCKFDHRDRAFEIRTLQEGELALIKGGNFHGLVNLLDENVNLFMFGGYD